MPSPLSAEEILARLGVGLDTESAGPLAGVPMLTVDLDRGGPIAAAATMLRRLPCVAVGVTSSPAPPDPAPDLDVLLAAGQEAPRPWVASPAGVEVVLADLDAAVHRSPFGAASLVQLLRLGQTLDLGDALVAESLVYSMLQSGPEFGAWLAGRRARSPAPAVPVDSRSSAVLVERRGSDLMVTFNRPEVRNAFNTATRDGMVAALQIALADPTVGEVHLHGAGPSFCSGGDLTEFGTAPDPVTAHLVRTSRSPAALLAACAGRTTAHVHGACVGAGVELASFAGRVHARPDAYFVLPEVGMGLVPGAGGTAGIPRRIGRQRTAFLALTGAPLDATTALAWGLVDLVET